MKSTRRVGCIQFVTHAILEYENMVDYDNHTAHWRGHVKLCKGYIKLNPPTAGISSGCTIDLSTDHHIKLRLIDCKNSRGYFVEDRIETRNHKNNLYIIDNIANGTPGWIERKVYIVDEHQEEILKREDDDRLDEFLESLEYSILA